MTRQTATADISPPRGRLLLGGAVLIFGWLCPLFVPLVLASNLPAKLQTILAGLLLLGIPEIFTLAAVAILGKTGYEYFKGAFFRLFRRLAPPDRVGLSRYRIGLAMFLLPILFAWASIYVPEHIPGFAANPKVFAIAGDLMFVASLFVLGGDFWDKLRALFVHGAKARFPECNEQ